MIKAEYDAVSDYACAPEAENAELKSGRGNNVTTISTLEAASAATETTTGLLAEMRAVHAAQMREMTALGHGYQCTRPSTQRVKDAGCRYI